MIEDRVLAEYEQALSGEERVVEPVPAEAERPIETVERAKTEEEQESLEGKTLEEVAEIHLRDSFWNP
jgi:hypothetical protein